MTPIKNSSNVDAAHHNGGSLLTVKFKGGATYHYENVTPAMHKAFVAADSKGAWIRANLLNKSAHAARKVEVVKKK